MEVQLMAARTILAFVVLTLVGLIPSQLAAQSNSSGPGSTADESWVILRVSSIIRPGVKISTIRYQLDGLFRAADLDGGGLAGR